MLSNIRMFSEMHPAQNIHVSGVTGERPRTFKAFRLFRRVSAVTLDLRASVSRTMCRRVPLVAHKMGILVRDCSVELVWLPPLSIRLLASLS